MTQDSLFTIGRISELGTASPVDKSLARQFISDHHYLGRPGSVSFAFALWSGQKMIGACTYGPIIGKNAVAICGERWSGRVLELTRLVILDDTPTNSESHFIAETFRWLDRPRILLSYADTNAGHVGVIYQATNWIYTGTSNQGTYVDPDGTPIATRTVSNSRSNAVTSGVGYRWRSTPPKHRYLYFLGSRTEKRAMRRDLRWEPKPYPRVLLAEESA